MDRREDGKEDSKARGRRTFLECAAIVKTQTTSLRGQADGDSCLGMSSGW
jgi:hypothetical protein